MHGPDGDTRRLDEVTEPMAPQDQEPSRLPRGATVDRYVIIDELGAGGMGVVYAAYDPELDRRVAIKVLQPSLLGEGRPRLLREAKAIARIAHPNVVAVHDGGEREGSVFLAMEFVEGLTLGQWLKAEARALPEILRVFRQAGQGLAAAHAADLVHRDFKPDNVLVGKDGRVRVVDFGLARGRGSADSISGFTSQSLSTSLDEALTEHGTVMGTPAYMAPEQLAGQLATAGSDQFAFCVALYEALYGERPFPGKTLQSLSAAVFAGTIREPAPDRAVPTWLRRLLVQGLALRERDRHPSMDALLQAMLHDPALQRRRRLLAGATAVGLLGSLAAAYFTGASAERSPCAAAADDLRPVWHKDRRRGLARAFRGAALPYAEDTWERVEQQVDAYARDWAAQATEACEATHVTQTQSAELLQRRRQCLSVRLRRLDAFLEILATPDTSVIDRAVQSARGLPDLGGCRDLDALQAGVAPPEREQTRRRVEEIREALTRAEALHAAGKYREELEVLTPLLAQARELGYLPLIAQLEHELAGSQRALDQPEGIELLRASFRDALAAGDNRRATMAAIDVAHELGYEQRLHAEGREWIAIAEALLRRIGGDPRIEIALTNTLAMIAIRQANYDEAQALFERLVAKQRALDPDNPNLAVGLMNLGSSHAERRDFEPAREYLQQAVELTERVLGPQHPSMTSLYVNLGLIAALRGQYQEAEVQLQQALALQRMVYGEQHVEQARTLVSLAVVRRNLGDPVESERLHREALTIRRAKLGPDHPAVAESLRNLGWAVSDQDRHQEAIEMVQQAQRIAERRLAEDHPEHGTNAAELALLLVRADRFAEALGEADRAIEILEVRGHGPNASLDARRARGIAQRGLGRATAAVETLEQALASAVENKATRRELGQLRLALALSLEADRQPLSRTRALMQQARDDLAETSAAHQKDRDRVNAWLAAHPSP